MNTTPRILSCSIALLAVFHATAPAKLIYDWQTTGSAWGLPGNWSPAGIPGVGAWICNGVGQSIVVDDSRTAAGGTLAGTLEVASGRTPWLLSALR